MHIPSCFKALFVPPDPANDAACAREDAWVRQYKSPPGMPHSLVLEHARRRYADSAATAENLNALADQLLRMAGMLSTILVAAIAGFGLEPGWSLRLSLVCFLLSMFIVLSCRRPSDSPLQARIRDVLTNVAAVANPEAWLAASLHGSVEGMKVLSNWKAKRLGFANLLICLGVACLLPIVFSV